MTPEDAESFYEDDEDPQKIFDRFDAGIAAQVERGRTWIVRQYGSARPWSYEQGGKLTALP